MNSSVNINNKKAKYDYSLLDKYTCGIVLTGNEIKSIRNSKASLNNAYCEFEGDELFVVNMHIDLYENSSETNYDPKRRRKLLLNRQELKKIEKQVIDVGITVVATSLFLSKKGMAKLNISVAKGKREFDKRNVIKDRESKITLKRIKKDFNT
ncbi:MAG: SsrA-binding protein [Cryomorphaceae bacterium MED-G11]|jgi:SsrA-binding protein|nr:SsrA-binding protein [Flavobacteriaceae bacterium]PDH53924.1 MAG: SsrA-binding protein [Cryomorphaceae bacterium MED-G11]|tara:strand:- start:104 stop:562 length:459 start_codon:yes stop_codon:yes gene_type:complete